MTNLFFLKTKIMNVNQNYTQAVVLLTSRSSNGWISTIITTINNHSYNNNDCRYSSIILIYY